MELFVRVPDPAGSTLIVTPPTDNRWPANPAARISIRTARDIATVHITNDECRAVAALLLVLAGGE